MLISNLTLEGTWGIPTAGFAAPMFLQAPARTSDNLDSTGFDITSGAAVSISFTGSYTGVTLVHEQTLDPSGEAGWFPVLGASSAGGAPVSTGSTVDTTYTFAATGVRHRVQVTAIATGTLEARVVLTDGEPAASGSSDTSGLALESTLEQVRQEVAAANEKLAAMEEALESSAPVGSFPMPENPVSGFTTSLTGTTSEPVAGMDSVAGTEHNYITALTVSNSDTTTGTEVQFLDGDDGDVIWTLPAAANFGGAAQPFPTPLIQPTAGNGLYARCTVAGATVVASACGFQAEPLP